MEMFALIISVIAFLVSVFSFMLTKRNECVFDTFELSSRERRS